MSHSTEYHWDEYPDRWVVIKVAEDLYKILAGWMGGYLGADEWRVSSGIVNIMQVGEDYYIRNKSGSIYRCNKKYEGFNSMTSSIFNRFKSELGDEISVVSMNDALQLKFRDDALIKEMIKNPDRYL